MPKRWSDDGFTFVEVLVAIALLSVVGVATSRGLSQALRSVGRTGVSLAQSARLARLDDSLRSLSGRIRVPYWAADQAIATGADELRVGWLDGDPERELSLGFRDGVLAVGDGRTVERYAGFGNARFSVLPDQDGRTVGIGLELLLSDGSRVTVLARLGSMPVRGGSAR
jgi:prepilin-type N-terminal cleavage/methylation domain-containing protein